MIDKAKEESAKIEKKTNKLTQSSIKKSFAAGLSLSEEDALRAQIFGCWSVPLGLPFDDDLLVRIKLQLNKDGTILNVTSKFGIYNNKTLDMIFEENIIADYGDSNLTAENAEYSNSKGLLTITNKVKINDNRGNLIADKLLFDLKNQTLNIASLSKSKINAKIKLNEKRF